MVAGLQRPELAGRSFDIGGPEALTGEEIAGVLAKVLGRSMHYHALSLADFAAGLNAGLGGRIGDEIAACYAWLAQNQAALVGDMRPTLAALPTLSPC